MPSLSLNFFKSRGAYSLKINCACTVCCNGKVSSRKPPWRRCSTWALGWSIGAETGILILPKRRDLPGLVQHIEQTEPFDAQGGFYFVIQHRGSLSCTLCSEMLTCLNACKAFISAPVNLDWFAASTAPMAWIRGYMFKLRFHIYKFIIILVSSASPFFIKLKLPFVMICTVFSGMSNILFLNLGNLHTATQSRSF